MPLRVAHRAVRGARPLVVEFSCVMSGSLTLRRRAAIFAFRRISRLEGPLSETLAERDLRALMAIIEDGRRDEPTEGLPWAVLDGLAGLVRCFQISFAEADLSRGRALLDQWVEDGERGIGVGNGDLPDAWWESVRSFLPCGHAERTGDYASVVRWSDFYTSTELRDTSFCGLMPAVHGLHATFPTAPGHFRKISFWRDTGSDFTERDRLVVQLLRPHLYEIYLDSQRRRRTIPPLSRREHEVLELADQGFSNTDIARRLYISVATVRKHLEHIYDRTGARSRTAAAALTMLNRNRTIPPFDPETAG
jgi:DNA-binding CsgD family transcriptional regulator